MISAIVTWPLMFIGHGSPMNAIEDNVYSQKWKELGKTMPRPKSILAISAHWETDGIRVTGNVKQKTIHDFGGFPKALFDAQYTPSGSQELCKRVQELIPETKVDNSWGLDHGSWSILKVMYPEQDIPVIQLSLSQRLSQKQHYEIAKKLAPLRKEGVLIIGSGNIVHNLRELDWDNEESGHKWAVEFHNYIKDAILAKDHEKLINYKQHTGAKLSVPTVEHYLPLLYIIALQEEKDQMKFFADQLQMGSLSMLSLILQQ